MASERREVHDFDMVELHGHGDILIEQGETEELVIEAEEQVLPKLTSEVRDRRLVLGSKNGLDRVFHWHVPIHYHLKLKQIRGASVAGSGDLRAPAIHTDRLALRISGAGRMQVDRLEAQELELNLSGSGKVEVAGRVARQEITISGSGDVRNANLETGETRLQINGAGQVTLHATKALEVRIAGSGSVRYRGEPKLTQHIVGAGSIEQLEEEGEGSYSGWH